jgi:hypothetical protein
MYSKKGTFADASDKLAGAGSEAGLSGAIVMSIQLSGFHASCCEGSFQTS